MIGRWSLLARACMCWPRSRSLVDASNLVSSGRFSRRLQYIEEGYRQKMEDKQLEKAKDVTSSLAEHFSGRPRMAGGAIVSPALLKHAAEWAAQDIELIKQQHKAVEARMLQRNSK